MAAAAATARAFFCEQQQQRREQEFPRLNRPTSDSSISTISTTQESSSSSNIVLQPRVCTLRSYGSGGDGLVRTQPDAEVSPFLASLSDYIENSKKSRDIEIISGRLAMIAFAGAVTAEAVTGNSLFRKMDLEGIAEGGGMCLGAIICAAAFAWFSSARSRVGRIFTLSCNTFVDSLIDKLVDGLFYESELSDWSDDV